VAQYVSAIDLAIGIINTPTIIAATTLDYKYVSGSTATMGSVADRSSGANKRSWRQLK